MSDSASDNDHQLLQDIRAGNPAAFETLYHELYARLVLFAERYAVPPGESEEIVSDAFVKCWQLRQQFDALPPLKSFLYITVRNASLNAVRRAKTNATTPFTGQEEGGEVQPPNVLDHTEVLRAEISGALFREIERLEGRTREVILMTYRDGLSSAEIAERLGISPSTVNSHRSRAIAQLRVALADRYPLLGFAAIAVLLEKIF